jgi:putative ABC transport system permease protein
MILCGVFATAALALTLVALYAMCMHEVLTRRREFGVRLALGASPGSLRRLIFNDAVLLGVAGIVIGGIAAGLVSRSMQAVLFGLTATDWRVYGGVAVGVLVFASLASLVPALRAGSVHPNVVMREE